MTRSRVALGLVVVAVLLLILFLVMPRGSRGPAAGSVMVTTDSAATPAAVPSTTARATRNARQTTPRFDRATPVEANNAASAARENGSVVAVALAPTPAPSADRMVIPLPSSTPAMAEPETTLASPAATAADAVAMVTPTPAPEGDFCPVGTTLKYEKVSGTKQKWCEKGDRAGVEIKEGPFVAWFRDGKKHFQGEFREGRREGQWTEWYETGSVASRGEYRHGKRDGAWTFWREDGKKAEEGTYRNDEKTGHWVVFDDHGHRAAEGEIRTNDERLCKEFGRWVYYWPNGVKKEEGSFQAGRREGRWTQFDVAGRIVSVAEYHQGEKE